MLNHGLILLSVVILIFLSSLIVGLIWLFFDHGIDKLGHPQEWKDAGVFGERILYNTLTKKFDIPENQIFRNVYIPIKHNRSSEVDLLVVSKKGIFVFECKNYGGNIYGDAKRKKWIQYIGGQKNYFYNPLFQNKNHVRYLKDFLKKNEIEVPVFPLVTTISRGNWKIKNLSNNDYMLGLNCHFKDIYKTTVDSEVMIKNFGKICGLLSPLSRPGEKIKEEHITAVSRNYG